MTWLLLLFALTGPARAALPDCLSEPEFRALASELAPKVNLFAEAWRQDPAAEFYGGTTRDYLYWIKGRFQNCKHVEDAAKITAALRTERTIDVREFIVGDSDVDVVSEKGVEIDRARYGVKKIDTLSPEIFDAASEKGQNELVQGYIPAEKVRLSKHGVGLPENFGDGLGEIYSGHVTVHFTPPEVFAKGHYAKEGINHPILLALRYERLLGINYFKTHGAGIPDPKKLFAIDPDSEAAVRKVIEEASRKDALTPYFAKDQFKKWFNGAIQKSFRSYTNPTAAFDLMKHFGVDKLARFYDSIEPLNQYVFQRYRDEAAVAKQITALGVKPDQLLTPVAERFPDGFLYHGTKTEEAFRGILLQGFIPSEGGSGGAGLYGVPESHRAFAEKWGLDPQRLIRIPVKPDARIVDVTKGAGAQAWAAYLVRYGDDYEGFADAVGADLIRYPYGETEAYVVKNSAVLGKPEGVYRKVLTVSEARRLAGAVHDVPSLLHFADSLVFNNFSTEEMEGVLETVSPQFRNFMRGPELKPDDVDQIFRWIHDHRNTAGEDRNPIAQAILSLAGDDPAWMPGYLDTIQSKQVLHDTRNLWPAGWSGGPPELFQRTVRRLQGEGFFLPTGPFQTLAELNSLPGIYAQDPISRAWRDLARPEALRTLGAARTPEEIFEVVSQRTHNTPVRALVDDKVARELSAKWQGGGAFADFDRPIGAWSKLGQLLPRGHSRFDPLWTEAYRTLSPHLAHFLASLNGPSAIDNSLADETRAVLQHALTEADVERVVRSWKENGALAAYAETIHDERGLYQRWATLRKTEGLLGERLREEVHPLMAAKAKELWRSYSPLLVAAQHPNHGAQPFEVILSEIFRGDFRSEENVDFLAKHGDHMAKFNGIQGNHWLGIYVDASRSARQNPALAKWLLESRVSNNADFLVPMLQHEDSALRHLLYREETIAQLMQSATEKANFNVGKGPEAAAQLAAVMKRLRDRDQTAYERVMLPYLTSYLNQPVEQTVLATGLFKDIPGNPLFRRPEASQWLEVFIKNAITMYTGVDSVSGRALVQVLSAHEVQRMPGSSRWIEELLTHTRLASYPTVEAIIRAILEKEPWISHPRAKTWLASFRYSRLERINDHERVNTRENFLKRSKLLQPLNGLQESAWRRRISVEGAPAAAPSRCRAFFGRLLGGGR